jgi:hypothetical protein
LPSRAQIALGNKGLHLLLGAVHKGLVRKFARPARLMVTAGAMGDLALLVAAALGGAPCTLSMEVVCFGERGAVPGVVEGNVRKGLAHDPNCTSPALTVPTVTVSSRRRGAYCLHGQHARAAGGLKRPAAARPAACGGLEADQEQQSS